MRLICRMLVLVSLVTITSFTTAQLTAAEQLDDLIAFMSPKSPMGGHALGFIKPDGTEQTFPDFGVPPQSSWGFGPLFHDQHRMMLTSYEENDITKTRAGKVKTHTWIYDWVTRTSTEALTKNPPADQTRGYEVINNDTRVIATAYINGEERIFVMDLDGDNQVELTTAGGGFHYVLTLTRDEKRLAFHVTGGKASFYNPGAYSINVIDLETRQRILIAGQLNHLYFGPRWSPDERQLAFMDCLHKDDPKHFKAAICIGQADGSGHHGLTPPQTHWFGTPFGSNIPEWSPDGKSVTYSRLRPESDREMKQGGSQICLIDVTSGAITELTPSEPGQWDYRTAWSPDGSQMIFTRVRQGGPRELWLMDRDGQNAKPLTKGLADRGADFARWIRLESSGSIRSN